MCMGEAITLTRLHVCTGSSEPSLLAAVIMYQIICGVPFVYYLETQPMVPEVGL